MMEGDTGEQWTAKAVSARFIRACKDPRITVMTPASGVATSSPSS